MDWINLAQHKDQWRAIVNMNNKYLYSIKCSECPEQLSDRQLLK
jgi:hypothetical protein